jgi:pimeloyl-ACP methyl ester carboxylesterase
MGDASHDSGGPQGLAVASAPDRSGHKAESGEGLVSARAAGYELAPALVNRTAQRQLLLGKQLGIEAVRTRFDGDHRRGKHSFDQWPHTRIIAAMRHSRRAVLLGFAFVCVCGLAGCGSGGRHGIIAYTPNPHPADAKVVDSGREGSLRLQQITYTSSDGRTVPALMALPTSGGTLGCLVYQGGLGQTEEQFRSVHQGAAALRLATFTIDPRNTGERGSPDQVRAALAKPESIAAMLMGTVVDLRRGLDYLETRAVCRHNIAYIGTGFGAAVGAIVAGTDQRIKAVILTSLGATFKESLLVSASVAQSQSGIPVMVPGAAQDPKLLAAAVRILSPYDPERWVPKVAPRPVMIINGRFDPLVTPVDALELGAAARDPKTIVYFDGGDNPFASGPDEKTIASRVDGFLVDNLALRQR